MIGLALGLRRSEILGLKWSDLDLGDIPGLSVRQQLQRRPKQGLVLTDLKKPKARRDLIIPSDLVPVIRAYRAGQAEERLALGEAWCNDLDLVFTTPTGSPVDPDNFRHRLTRITTQAGLGPWTTHELRHSAGSLMFARDVPMKVISETLGHSSERVTSEVYVHTAEAHRQQAADAMSTALWGA